MKIELIDDIVSFFASQGPDAELQINLLLEKYVKVKRERDAEERRYLQECADAERRAQEMQQRGIAGAEAIGSCVVVPRHDAEIGVSIWSPPDYEC